jgi:hypothetical protein
MDRGFDAAIGEETKQNPLRASGWQHEQVLKNGFAFFSTCSV